MRSHAIVLALGLAGCARSEDPVIDLLELPPPNDESEPPIGYMESLATSPPVQHGTHAGECGALVTIPYGPWNRDDPRIADVQHAIVRANVPGEAVAMREALPPVSLPAFDFMQVRIEDSTRELFGCYLLKGEEDGDCATDWPARRLLANWGPGSLPEARTFAALFGTFDGATVVYEDRKRLEWCAPGVPPQVLDELPELGVRRWYSSAELRFVERIELGDRLTSFLLVESNMTHDRLERTELWSVEHRPSQPARAWPDTSETCTTVSFPPVSPPLHGGPMFQTVQSHLVDRDATIVVDTITIADVPFDLPGVHAVAFDDIEDADVDADGICLVDRRAAYCGTNGMGDLQRLLVAHPLAPHDLEPMQWLALVATFSKQWRIVQDPSCVDLWDTDIPTSVAVPKPSVVVDDDRVVVQFVSLSHELVTQHTFVLERGRPRWTRTKLGRR